MFGNQSIPKSQLGTDRVNKLFYEVAKVPTSLVMGDNMKGVASNLSSCVVGWPESTGFKPKLLNMVTDIYKVVPLISVVAPLEEAFNAAGYDYDVQYSNTDDRILTISYIFKERIEKTKKVGDLFSPVVSVVHSYSSEWSSLVECRLKRLVCDNGMSVPQVQKSMSKKFTASFGPEYIIDVCEKVGEFLENFGNILKVFKVLEERKMTIEEVRMISTVIPDKTGFPKTHVENALAIAYNEAHGLGRGMQMDSFTAYNGFNNIINHYWKAPIVTKLDTDNKIQKLFY